MTKKALCLFMLLAVLLMAMPVLAQTNAGATRLSPGGSLIVNPQVCFEASVNGSGFSLPCWLYSGTNQVDLTSLFLPAATASANQSGATQRFIANYWNGSATATDAWSIVNTLGTGTNPTSTLTISHAGSTGAALVSMPGSTDGWFSLGPANCSISQASGTETVASVLKIVGNVQAVQETTTTTTATHTVICKVNVPSRLTATKGATITDVNLIYGNSTGAIATCNAPTAGSQTGPAPGTSESAASATLVAAGGALTVTPVVASCNTTAISAGAAYTENIAFGTPIVLNTDRQAIYITQSFVGPSSATFTLNIYGVDVHYNNVPL